MQDPRHAQLAKAFVATVEANVHGLQAMLELLTCERKAIVARDAGALERVARDKLDILTQIEHGAKARARLQQAAGLDGGPDGGNDLVRRIADATLTATWQRLLTLGAEAATENERNGQLIAQGRRAARDALDILTGRSRQEDTYDGVRRRGNRSGASLGRV